MTYNIEKLQGSVKVAFEVDQKEWDGFVETVYQRDKGKIRIAGFRPGHAPRAMIERMYGKSVFWDDAFNDCFKRHYAKVLSENEELFPIEDPKVDVEKVDNNGLKYSLTFAVKPEVVLGGYKGLKIDKVEYKVTAKDIDAELEKARQRLSRKVEKDAPADFGDTVNLDYSGSVDGVKFDGGTATNQELELGSKTFIPGFEEQLVGIKKGETKDINVKFPDSYHAEELAGKDAVFNVTVHHIYIKELPALDDSFAGEASRFDTLKEYRQDIEKRLKEDAQKREKEENENKLIEKIVENTKLDVPPQMIETELEYMLDDFAQQLMYMYGGMKLDDYFKHTKMTREDYKKANYLQAEKTVKTRMILGQIIKDEKIEVTDEDIDAEYASLAEKAKKTKEEYLAEANANPEFKNYVKNTLLSKKMMEYLASVNTFEIKEKAKSKK